ncbi:MAG: hypothetical protein J7M21_05280 [Planctomycetes bacterium]|nr:hypothetical protein [Planctomycetota bacterium]
MPQFVDRSSRPQRAVASQLAVAAQFFAAAAMTFFATLAGVCGWSAARAALLGPAGLLLPAAAPAWQTFAAAAVYFPLLLTPASMYAVKRAGYWLAVGAMLVVLHAACLAAG